MTIRRRGCSRRGWAPSGSPPHPQAVTELIARCGHLPLALAVMAARAAADPTLPLASLAAQLAKAADAGATGEAGRLEVLETGDAATSLRELLSWSHRQLSRPGGGDVRAAGSTLRA